MTTNTIESACDGLDKSRLHERSIKIMVNLCLFVVTLVSASYLYWLYVEDRFLTVVENNVFRAAEMPADKLLEFVQEHQVRTVVDFRTGDDRVLEENRALTSKGIRSINIPSELVPSDEAVDGFLDVMGDLSNYPILFHCEHGIGRSSLFEAIYRIEYLGWSNEEARKSALVRSVMGSFETDDDRGQYILGYEPRGNRSLFTAVNSKPGGASH